MKRILGYSILTLLLLAGLSSALTGQPLNYLTRAVLQARAWTFTALQTFSGGMESSFPGAMSAPEAPTATAGPTSGGSCRSDTSYRFYISWKNVTGETTLSAASSPDFTPASGNVNKVTVTRGTLPSDANTWRLWFTRSTDSHVAVRGCSALGAVTEVAGGTSTFDCQCSTITDPAEPTSNTTTDVVVLRSVTTPSAVSFSRPSIAVKEVCPTGCEYASVSAALTAITDASATKPYIIMVHAPYQSTENVTAKSYVSVVGESKVGITAFGSMSVPAAVTNVGVSNVTISQIITSGNGSPGYVYVDNIICGSPSSTNIDCIHTPHDSWRFFVTNSILYSVWDVLTVGSNTTIWASFNTNIISTDGNPPKCWNVGVQNNDGVELYDYGSTCEITLTGAGPGLDVTGLWVNFNGSAGSRGNKIHIVDPVIRITNNSTSTANVSCVWLGAVPANSASSSISITGADCSILGTNAAGAHYGVKVDADADHATWNLSWIGGQISLAGGASRADVNNAETVGGFVLGISGVLHAGIYTGAGTTTIRHAPLLDGRTRQTPLATAPATCSIGDHYTDTSGADCACTATNTWTNTTAVGSCV